MPNQAASAQRSSPGTVRSYGCRALGRGLERAGGAQLLTGSESPWRGSLRPIGQWPCRGRNGEPMPRPVGVRRWWHEGTPGRGQRRRPGAHASRTSPARRSQGQPSRGPNSQGPHRAGPRSTWNTDPSRTGPAWAPCPWTKQPGGEPGQPGRGRAQPAGPCRASAAPIGGTLTGRAQAATCRRGAPGTPEVPPRGPPGDATAPSGATASGTLRASARADGALPHLRQPPTGPRRAASTGGRRAPGGGRGRRERGDRLHPGRGSPLVEPMATGTSSPCTVGPCLRTRGTASGSSGPPWAFHVEHPPRSPD